MAADASFGCVSPARSVLKLILPTCAVPACVSTMGSGETGRDWFGLTDLSCAPLTRLEVRDSSPNCDKLWLRLGCSKASSGPNPDEAPGGGDGLSETIGRLAELTNRIGSDATGPSSI